MLEHNLLITNKKEAKDPRIALLLEFNDSAGGPQNFVDHSNYKVPIQVVGNPKLEYDIFGPGTSYGYFYGYGSANQALIANALPGGLGSKDFCAEAWVLWSVKSQYDSIFQIGYGASSEYSGILVTPLGGFIANAGGTNWGGFQRPQMLSTVEGGIFRHIALVRKDGIYRLFNQGQKQGADLDLGYLPRMVNPEKIMIGNQTTAGNFSGYMEYFRLTIDDHRYWDNFTPVLEK